MKRQLLCALVPASVSLMPLPENQSALLDGSLMHPDTRPSPLAALLPTQRGKH